MDELEPIYLQGEYWFDASGDTMYADGDIGDMNHEAYVLQRLQSDLLSHFDIHPDEYYGEFDHYENEIKEHILDDSESGVTEEDLYDDWYTAMITYLNNKGVENAEEVVQLGTYGPKDARLYAIQNWGWSRVHGNSIEVNRLTPDQLKLVARGINNALEQEGNHHEEDAELRMSQAEYNISTYTGKRFKITLEDMEKGNVQGLERADIGTNTSPATQQLRKVELGNSDPFYRDRGLVGDSYMPSFKEFYNENTN